MRRARIHNRKHLHTDQVVRDLILRDGPDSDRFVVLDLDLLVCRFGPDEPVDRYMFIELKQGEAGLTRGQSKTFKEIDRDLRKVEGSGYCGFWRVNYKLVRGVDPSHADAVTLTRAFQCFLPDGERRIVEGHEAVWTLITTLEIPAKIVT